MTPYHRPQPQLDALPSRRDVLACVGCLSVGLWRPWAAESPTVSDDGSDEPPRTANEVVVFVPRWELSALASNWPDDWHAFRYTSAVRWSERLAIGYGVGLQDECEADLPRAIELAHGLGRRVPSAHLHASGQAWAIAIAGACDDRLRAAMQSLTPSWHAAFASHDQEALLPILDARRRAGRMMRLA